jgi:hypothetical protein
MNTQAQNTLEKLSNITELAIKGARTARFKTALQLLLLIEQAILNEAFNNPTPPVWKQIKKDIEELTVYLETLESQDNVLTAET